MNTRNWLTNWKNALQTRRTRRAVRRKTMKHSAAATELLEPKALLTGLNCFGQIEGVTFQDINNNGAFNSGEELSNAVHGVVVHLYEDGGNGVLNSTGGVAGGDDTFIGTANPDANGNYEFTDLPAGTYFTEQPTPTGFIQKTGDDTNGPIVITAADAAGKAGSVVDSFGDPVGGQLVFTASGTPDSSSVAIAGIGSERDLLVTQLTGGALVSVQANSPANTLALSLGASTTGIGNVTWDGIDGSSALDPIGLRAGGATGIDLTDAGDSEGFVINHDADLIGGTLSVTVYTDGSNSSTLSVAVPITATTVYLPYDTFTDTGTGADFSNVGAVVMEITGPADMDATVIQFQAYGPTVFTSNFTNFVPLTLGGTVFEDSNNSGDITVSEPVINGVTTTLFEDTNGNGIFDAGDLQVTNATSTATTVGGSYEFSNLFPGNYIVRIDPGNFAGAAVLDNFVTSTGNDPAPDPDDDVDGDDNGSVVSGVVVSQAISLNINTEPTNDGDSNANTNYSLDFGLLELVDIAVTKSDNVDPVTAGSGANNLEYTVTATNNGPSDATGVVLTDAFVTTLPTGWTLVSGVGTAGSTFTNGTGVWTIGNLASGDTRTLTLTFTIDGSAASGTVTNTATVTSVNETESNTANNTASEDTTIARLVDIAVTKSDNVDPVTAGSGANNLEYTVTATNNGPSDATGVVLTDAFVTTLPTGWTLVSGVGTAGSTFTNGTGVWTIGNLASGDTRTLTLTFTIDGSAASGTVTNTATVTSVNETESNTANNTASEDTTIARLVDIAVTKSDNVDPVTAGSGANNLEYTVTATNNGPSDATGVVLTDAFVTTLPTGWTLVSGVGTAGSTFTNGTGVWTIGDLASGDTRTLTLTFTIDGSAASGTVTNTATVTSVNETDSNTANNTASEDTTIARLVDIAVTKSDNVDPVTAGSGANNLQYTVTATNSGLSDATGVAVTDAFVTSLPIGWTLVSGSGTGTTSFASATGVWTIGNLAVGDTETLTLTFTVDDTAASGTITNTATVSAVNEPETATANNTASEDTTVARQVDIQVVKSDNVDPVTAGSGAGNLIYTVVASNNGPSDATGVQITDALVASLPTGWALDSANGTGSTTFNTGTGIWNIGNLDSGDSETLTVTVTIGSSAAVGTTTNTATVSALNEADTNPANNTDSEDTTIARLVDVQVVKSDNVDPVTAGSGAGNLIYTVVATNNGPSDSTGVVVTDALIASLPVDWTLVSAAGTGTTSFAAGTGAWTIGNLDAGDSETLTVTLTVGASADAVTTTNTATVTALNEIDSNPANNTDSEDTTVNRIVDVSVQKSDNVDPVDAGSGAGNLVYTIVAMNAGPSNASGVAFTDALMTSLPSGWTLVSASGSGTTSFSSSTGVWSVGSLNTGASETLTLTLTVGNTAAAGITTNTVALSSINETDSNATNNQDSEDTTINTSVDIAVTKADSVDPVTAGSGTGNLTYTVTATNVGTSLGTGIQVTDALIASLPTGFSLVSANGSGGTTFNSSTGVWNIGSLATNETRTLTVLLTVGESAAAGTITNIANVSSVDQTDVNPANNTATENTTVLRQVDIAVTKVDLNDPVVAGSGAGNLTYTVTAVNNGPSSASGLQLTDALLTNLPTGITLDSVVGSNGSTFDSGTGIWNIGNLSNGDSRTLTVTLTVGNTATVTRIDNSAGVTSLNEPDPVPGNDTDTETTAIQYIVDIAVDKTDSTDPVLAGSGVGNLSYTITATNNGPADATGLQIADASLTSLPPGVSVVSATGTGGTTFNSGTGIWNIGNLANGDSRQLVVVVTVADSVTVSSLTNVARVSRLDQTDPNPGNDISTEVTQIGREIDLVVTKVDDVDPVRSPGTITYTITVANNGPSSATNVVMTDTLSSQVTYLSATASQGTATESGGVVTSSLGTIPGGGSATVTLRVNVDLPLGGTVDNIASATATETETNFTNNTDDEATEVTPQLFTVSGVVYQDLNGNGIQDNGEVPIQDAQVGLFGEDDNGNDVLQVITTDATGAYLFANLIQGEYNLFEVQPAIYEDGIETPGTGAGVPITGEDRFVALNLNAANGANAVGFNFGEGIIDESKRDFLASNQFVVPPAPIDQGASGTLGGRVALDANGNGIFDTGDTGILGASVTLAGTKTDGTPVVVTARTDENGLYQFTGVPAGNYNLIEAQPFGYSDGSEQTGTLLSGSVLDDVFADIAFPDAANGSGFNFLERPANAGGSAGAVAPVLAAQAVETDANPTLSWMPVNGAIEYEVWLTQVTNDVGLVYHNENVSGTSLTVPTALALGTHKMWVRGIDAQGLTGPWSAPSSFDVSPQPQMLSPKVATVDSRPTFEWAAVSGATLYDFVIQDATGKTVEQATDLASTRYTSSTTLDGGQHTIWIRSKNDDIVGQWSDGINFAVAGAPQLLGPKTASSLAAPMLEWNDTGAGEYRVWVSDVTAGSTKVLDTKVQGTSMLLTTNLQPGNRYRYWVQGVEGSTNTAWSSAHTFTVADRTTITSPTKNSANSKPTIEWDAFPGATHYDLWVADGNGLFLRDEMVSGNSYTFRSAVPDGNYRVWVQPEGLSSAAKWSKAAEFTVGGLSTPKLTSPSSTTDRTPTINWTQDSSARSTEIWVNHNGVTNRIIHENNVNGSSYTPTFNLVPGTYSIWIRSRSMDGLLSSWSKGQQLKVV